MSFADIRIAAIAVLIGGAVVVLSLRLLRQRKRRVFEQQRQRREAAAEEERRRSEIEIAQAERRARADKFRVRLHSAQEAFERGDLERAGDALNEAIRLEPENPEGLEVQRRLRSAAERIEEFRVRLLAAHDAFERGDLERAAHALNDALRLKPEDAEALQLQDWLRSAAEELQQRLGPVADRAAGFRLRLQAAHDALEMGDLKRAAHALNEALRLKPGDIDALQLQQRLEAVAAQTPRVRFHTLWHRSIPRDQWRSLIVYLYSGSYGLEGARSDFRRRMGVPARQFRDSVSTVVLHQGTAVTIVPEVPGFTFNPPTAIVHWLEQWHCVESRMRTEGSSERVLPTNVLGRVAFFVGPLLIAENEVAVSVLPGSADTTANAVPTADPEVSAAFFDEAGAPPYRAIFVSYSREDASIVDQLEKAYRALGDSYLRDIRILRSGEDWNSGVLSAIPTADVFQLCWSTAAKNSRYVEHEWRGALGLDRPHFVRPVFWQRPMPEPPQDLRHLHFTFVDMQ